MTSFSRRAALTALPVTGLLGAGGASTAAAQAAPVAPVASTAPTAPTAPAEDSPVRLAFVADTHADPENAETTARLRAVFEAIEAIDPTLVIHGGDVTEHGIEAEYQAFEEAVPTGLRERIAAVPGNHETRWDASAGKLRAQWIGEEVRFQDVDGMRVILADTTTHQQEVAWWSARALTELEQALRSAGNLPCVLVTHFPMGEGYYYVANQQEFEDVLATHPIALHLTGHTHRELLTRVNRRDQLEAAAVKIDAAYYELTGSIDSLQVTRVDIPDPAAPTQTVRTPVTTYDLTPQPGRDTALPLGNRIEDDGGSIALDVTLRGSFQGALDAVLYDTTVYAGRNDKLPWTPLQGSGHRFSGRLDASALASGRQRVHVRVRPDDGSGNRLLTLPVVHGSRGTAWEAALPGMIQGGPAVVGAGDGNSGGGGEVLVAGDSTGTVLGLDRSGATRWTADVDGEIRHDLLAVDGGRSVAVPDTAGFVHLFAADGSRLWRYGTDAQLAADPGTGTIDGAEVLMVCSGATLHVIDAATGGRLWTAQLPASSMGAPATDGERVYVGGGDGCAHALDARTGASVWTTSLTDKQGSYQRFIYGPWNDAITVLPDGGVIASGIADTWCLEPDDGSSRWRVDGSFQYAHESLTEDGDLVLANEGGEIVRIDPATGAEITRLATAERILDEGFVLDGDVVYASSHSGLITAVDLGSGSIEQLTRLSSAPVLARGVAFGDHLVFGDLAGTVHAVERV